MLIIILLSLGKLSKDIVPIFLGTLSRDIIPIFFRESVYQDVSFLFLCHKCLVGQFVSFPALTHLF